MRFVTCEVPTYKEAREGLTVYSPPMLRFFTTKEGTRSWSSGIVARIAVSMAYWVECDAIVYVAGIFGGCGLWFWGSSVFVLAVLATPPAFE